MHNELRYQAKTHTISEKQFKKNKNYASSPPIYIYIYFENNKIEKQQKHAYTKKKTA